MNILSRFPVWQMFLTLMAHVHLARQAHHPVTAVSSSTLALVFCLWVHIFKRLRLPLRLIPKATEKINWVFVGDFPIRGAEVVLNCHWDHKTLHVNSSSFYERLYKQAN